MSDFEKMLHSMFSSIWDCEIDHPLWQDTVGEIMTAVIQAHEKCIPEPYGDAVSRQAAIDALQKCRKHCIDPFDSYHIDIQDAEYQLSKLPTIQPETPCYLGSPCEYQNPDVVITQPEPQEGHWIPHESPDGGVQYECSECGVLWEFNDGSPEDNEAFYCPKCGAKMKGADT